MTLTVDLVLRTIHAGAGDVKRIRQGPAAGGEKAAPEGGSQAKGFGYLNVALILPIDDGVIAVPATSNRRILCSGLLMPTQTYVPS